MKKALSLINTAAKKNVFAAVLVLTITACNNIETGEVPNKDTTNLKYTEVTPNDVSAAPEPFILEGCYQMTMKRDSAFFRLNLNDSLVTGQLTYNFYEKDKNDGTFKGYVRDSLIVGNYTFNSEGITSVREVVFKIENNSLWPAFGRLDEKDGRMVFESMQQIQFDSIHPFLKVDCSNL